MFAERYFTSRYFAARYFTTEQVDSSESDGRAVTVGDITEIVIGDDYFASESRAFLWTVPAVAGTDPSEVTVWFGGEAMGDIVGSWRVQGTAEDAGDGNWTLTAELPGSATVDCEPGFYNWSAAVHLNSTGRQITKVRKGKNSKTQLIRKYT